MLRPYNGTVQFGSGFKKRDNFPEEELHGQPLVCKKTDEHVARGIAGGRRAQSEAHARPVSADGIGRRRDHRRWDFRAFRFGRALRRPGPDAFLWAFGARVRIRGALLCRVFRDDPAGGPRFCARLRSAGRTSLLAHRVGPQRRTRHWRGAPFARLIATIVTIKVAVVLFVIGLGIHYVDFSNWGHDWSTFAPMGFSGIGAGAAYIFFAYIGFDAVSTTAQEAKNPQRDLPIGIIVSLLICTILYISVAGVLTGMVHWQDVNIEAPIARAFLDRGLSTASHVITLGALAGLTSVMLVMLLGQTRVLYAMANDG